MNSDQSRCSACSFGDLCLPSGSDDLTLGKLDALLETTDGIAVGRDVVMRGDAFAGLLAVRSGCFKSYTLDRDGNEQVQGFHFPGEIIGMDAINSHKHRANVQALSDASLCEFDYQSLLELSACSSGLQQQLFRLFSGKLAGQHWRTMDFTASERLAAFFLDISERLNQRGMDGHDFELAMSRSDIGNYLSLATETVSRVVTKFKVARLLQVDRKRVKVLDVEGLRHIAQPVFDAN
ncbi:MAG: helix-turn-helix domain-containing protein [Pseudomonadota bacterium]